MAACCGTTALHMAANSGKKDVVQVILDAGADINMAKQDGRTALSSARASGYRDIAKILIDRGAQ